MKRKNKTKVETAHNRKSAKELDPISAYKRINEEYLLIYDTCEILEVLRDNTDCSNSWDSPLQFIAGELKTEIHDQIDGLITNLETAMQQLRYEAKITILTLNKK
jgi:hypothetical protein